MIGPNIGRISWKVSSIFEVFYNDISTNPHLWIYVLVYQECLLIIYALDQLDNECRHDCKVSNMIVVRNEVIEFHKIAENKLQVLLRIKDRKTGCHNLIFGDKLVDLIKAQ